MAVPPSRSLRSHRRAPAGSLLAHLLWVLMLLAAPHSGQALDTREGGPHTRPLDGAAQLALPSGYQVRCDAFAADHHDDNAAPLPWLPSAAPSPSRPGPSPLNRPLVAAVVEHHRPQDPRAPPAFSTL
ncbi:hypothetical protein ACRYJU_12130 [Alloalcanivorax xenomutans]|uniref:hypothetical protein n=1 Tax=Alloalcanivorax xenomutans TaxID=1094342 RepID=UPI0007A733C9|nr:hypothetical protein [Alloalcanivorax xenomutans]KYZ87858.1 hypothetical protein A3Q32_00020 [Alcanivorax sp. KX64203]MCE7522022.1 hypothetical protein [Alloalcanivorax xenomutans]WOA29584.1 hypothetical protein RVY87_11890 [Alloalcanivorax xenomutans]